MSQCNDIDLFCVSAAATVTSSLNSLIIYNVTLYIILHYASIHLKPWNIQTLFFKTLMALLKRQRHQFISFGGPSIHSHSKDRLRLEENII